MSHTYRLVVGGELATAASGETFDSIDPSTGEPFATVAKAGSEDARKAAEAARKAFDEGPWPGMKGRERAAALLKVADMVKQNSAALAELEARDAGHTIRMAKGADIGMVISTFRVFAELAAKENDEAPLARNPGSMNYARYEPIGVCVGITPWNFPIQMAAWKIAPAIAAGNTIVIKPATYTPLSPVYPKTSSGRRSALARWITDRDNPLTARVAVNHVWLRHFGRPLVPTVFDFGRKGQPPTHPQLLDWLAAELMEPTRRAEGRKAPGAPWSVKHLHRIVMLSETYRRSSRHPDPKAVAAASDEGPIVSETQLETVERYVGIGREEGADVLTGGERAVVEGHDGGFYFQPTVLGNVKSGMRVSQEEIFGPVLVIIPFEDEAEAVRIANDSVYGLAGGVWSGDNSRAIKVAERIRTGTVWINDYHMINPRYPFGGYKQSGIGREHGEFGFNEYREIKHIHVDLGGPSRARHPWWDLTVPKREKPSPPGPERPGSKPSG